ncbi:transcriptional regulator (plasmid) [Pedobacter sp. BS3]|uniref:ligand-binding sensor domain-containing protein n=1 Tax=Pedobacter sp. BS3 TaxID=2567937 RepID=UPI0011EFDACB|nr:triple tyrosine motif-containing protein [Pedobacter sp. BS3]TZF86009.1 transcriptional regulator [Pedobacter sp. BS3]
MRYLYLLIIICCVKSLQAQNPIGIPQINTYGSLDYRGGTQNWDIDQDKNGILYFANNEGLLTFDGRHWNLYPLPHKTIVRSLKVSRDGKIYVGAQDEIGYFFPDKNGVLKFHSIRNLIPEPERQFSDLWDIVALKDELFFRTTNKIFYLRDGVIKVYKPQRTWEFMGQVNGVLYAQDSGKGLLTFQDGAWQPVVTASKLKDYITAILPYQGDTLLVTTLKNGLFLLGKNFFAKKTSPYDASFSRYRLYKAIQVSNDWYAVATSSGGCYIIDKAGRIVQQFSSAEGLYKNNLRSIFIDRNKNLWLGLDDGINFIAFNNAIKYIYPDKDKQTSSYATLIYNNVLYIGTSNGVFYTALQANNKDLSYSKNPFNEFANTAGQVWSLREINRHVLVGHEDGAYVIDGGQAKQLYSSPGTWLFNPLSSYPTQHIIAGTYGGLQLITFQNNQFINRGHITGLNNESLRFLLIDNGVIWASHPYRGIYRLRLSPDLKSISEIKLYTEKNGLPSALGNCIAKIRGKIVAATTQGIYEYDARSDRFIPSAFLTPILKKNVYHYLKEDKDGNIWFISFKKVGLVDFNNPSEDSAYTIVHFPELNSQVVAGFENIYPYDAENIFIGANKGLIHINYKKYIQNLKPIDVMLSLVKATGKQDSVIYGGYFLKNNRIEAAQDKNQKVELTKNLNSLHFEYSSTLYEQQNNIEFSYQLSGFDKEWSAWSAKSEKDYTNLPYGNYTFKVKARNNLRNESPVISYSFYIKPAWYETVWIYALYVIVLIGLVYLLIRRQKKKHEKAQAYLKHVHQLEIEHNEKEIVKLKNEKLEAEISYKQKELATTSMHLVQKNKLLLKIKEVLLPLVKLDAVEHHSEDLKKVLRLLNDAERRDADWEQFAVHFDHVHSNFLSTLKEKFPNLSPNDLKLCAYLKMNLSSKEIAQLMSITIRAVEVSRYRLRKKLQVSSDTNLFDYLIQVTSQK